MKLGQQSQQLHDMIGKITTGSPHHFKKSRPLSETSRLFLQTLLKRLHAAHRRFQNNQLIEIAYPAENFQTADLFSSVPREIRDIVVGSPE
jgi:hypothetical protein